MAWRMVKAVLILPGTAAVLVPGLITWAAAGPDFGGPVSPPGDIRFWAGLGLLGLGICFGAWTGSLFVTIGKDHTIFAVSEGKVSFRHRAKGRIFVSVEPNG